ncbi:hypothetical protein JOQ06_016053, partial [Pogonophryne albipinna]
ERSVPSVGGGSVKRSRSPAPTVIHQRLIASNSQIGYAHMDARAHIFNAHAPTSQMKQSQLCSHFTGGRTDHTITIIDYIKQRRQGGLV